MNDNDAAGSRDSAERLYTDATVATVGNWHSSARVEVRRGGRAIDVWPDDETRLTYPRDAVESIGTVLAGEMVERPAEVTFSRRMVEQEGGLYDRVVVLDDGWIRAVLVDVGLPTNDSPTATVSDHPPEVIQRIEWENP